MITMLAARLTPAAIFAVAAVAKLSDRSGARRAVIAFGVPQVGKPVTLPKDCPAPK